MDMVNQKVDIGVFRHTESKSGPNLSLTLLVHRFLATFSSNHMTIFASFSQNDWLLGKSRQPAFLEYTPLCTYVSMMRSLLDEVFLMLPRLALQLTCIVHYFLVPKKPKDFNIRSSNTTCIEMEWKSPGLEYGKIDYYEVRKGLHYHYIQPKII